MGIPSAGSSSPIAFHAEGMKAQSSATLRSTRGFSARASNTGIGPHEMQPHRVARQHELGGHDHRHVALGPARCDQVAEGMGLHEGAPLPFAASGVDGGDEHRLSLAQAGAALEAGPDRLRPDPDLLDRLGPVALVVDLAVRRPADRGDAPHAPGRLVVSQAFLDVGDQLRLAGLDGAVRRLDHGHDLLTVGRVRDPDDDGVSHGLMRLQRLLHLLGEDLLAPRVDADRPPPEQVDGAVRTDLGVVARDGVAHAVDHLERPFRLLVVLVVPERVAPAEREHAHLFRARRDLAARPRVSTFTSGPSVNDAVLAAAPPPETDTPMPRASDELNASTRSMAGGGRAAAA